MILLEIILTVIAWNRGWRSLALCPMGVAFGLGLLFGMFVTTDMDTLSIAGTMIDGGAVIALIVMIACPDETQSKTH